MWAAIAECDHAMCRSAQQSLCSAIRDHELSSNSPCLLIRMKFPLVLNIKHHRLLLLVLWAVLSATCAQTHLCSSRSVVLTVASPKDVAELAAAALCDNAVIRAVWQGNIQLAETIVIGNGTSVTVAGASAKTAVIGGGNKIQLFDVWGQLNLTNLTLSNGNTAYSGGAIYSRANTKVFISGSVFSGHRADYGGAILSDFNSSLTITDCQFSNNTCSRSGGAIYSYVNSMLSVFRAQFDGNTAVTGAGAIYAGNNSMCTISGNSTFTNNNASNGAAVYSDFNSTLSISSCEFSSNNSSVGTVFSASDSTLTVTSSRFDSNTAAIGAGAIFADNKSVCTINSSQFTNNSATFAAVVVTSYNSRLIIGASHFDRNSATKIGGVIYIADNATATINTSIFQYNTGELGAAVYSDFNSALAITDCEISSNNGSGGTVYSGGNSDVIVKGTRFDSNTASYGAGAIFAGNSSICIINSSQFTNNSAPLAAVILTSYNSRLTIEDCEISDNNSNSSGNIYIDSESVLIISASQLYRNKGKVIFTNANATSTISTSSFKYNTGESGAAVYSSSYNTLNITDCEFSNNNGTTGTVYSGVNSVLAVFNTSFVSNTASDGAGAIYADENSVCTISGNSKFTNNSAESGGAVAGDRDAKIAISNSHFSFNHASSYGGGLYTRRNCNLVISNTTFLANSAAEGGGIKSFGNLTVTGCQFSDHTAQFGAALVVQTNLTASISNCSFTNNNASTIAGALYIGTLCAVTVKDCAFSNNTATNYAGSTYVDSDSIVNITATSFTGGSAAVGGALVAVTRSRVILRDVHMRSNTAVNGGAIAIQAELYVYDCSFSNNTATSRGGILGGETQSSVEMYNSTMNDNACQASRYATTPQNYRPCSCGYALSTSTCTHIAGNGGAVFTSGTVVFHSCFLTNNTAGLNGGAVYTDYGAVGSMKNCLVSGNAAQQSGGGWFGFGKDQVLKLNATRITNNSAACCYASGYGSKLTSNATLTCADTDSGENRGDCCYSNQYSNGESCVTCEQGTDCSVIGTSLATQSLIDGYWRASTTSTDVRPCWFTDACRSRNNSSSATSTGSKNCSTTLRVSSTMSSISSDNILFEDSDGCNDTTTTSPTSTVSVTRVDDTMYCAQGYKGPLLFKYYYATILHYTTTLFALTDCAICAEGYSKSIGYECTQCKSGTKAAIYTGLALLLLAIILFIWFMTLELLGLGDGQDAVTNIPAFGCMKKLASLPWDKLRIPIVAFQIVTQYISITGLLLPNIYRKFLSWADVFNLNLGWLVSLGCLTQIDFYQKLLITTLGPLVVAAALAATYATVRYRNKVQVIVTYTSQRTVVPARTSKLEKALAKHHLVFLAMTFLIYSTVSTTVFQTFA
eukprot:11904-Heterococcus_DN1.PRE.1